MQRDGATKSLWQQGIQDYLPGTNFPEDLLYDVLIVGGGITGIATGLLLQQSGKKCLVAEAKNIGFGTSGGTTAHLNTVLDSSYPEIEKNFNESAAAMVCSSTVQAINLIEKNIHNLNIDCGFSKKNGYLFSSDEKQTKELEEIFISANKAGCMMEWSDTVPINLSFQKAVVFKDQAQFHPSKYLYGIAKGFENAGGVIIQNCRIGGYKENENDILNVESSKGTIRTKALIYATHIPPGVNILHFRCAPYRSYVLGIKLNKPGYPDGLVYDMYDPYHYYRTQEIDGENYLIAGGEDHKTGHEENTAACYTKLESHLHQYFDFDSVAFKWSSQYYQPADGLPYIGNLPGNPSNVYTATGYNGNGIIYGHVAAKLLTDLIVRGKSELEKLFDPNRVKPVAGFSNFVKEAADVVSLLIGQTFKASNITGLSEIAKGEAKVVQYEGHSIALYKDDKGNIHALNPACTHIKCMVVWNDTEQSWDCPCHGSRFDPDGELLTAPARKNLEKIELKAN
jgi:glycine/D-amino acid oxidase-like deaminating enzyme/nitrite reductase/ring-hydroxylating ferredoxin subunit